MLLQQGQVWQKGAQFFRIVKLERLAVDYKEMPAAVTLDGRHHSVTKKEFCRLIKGATLVPPPPPFKRVE
ncbi:MAG: hypothetical protein U1F77_10185 [Kiritimatiellia bacterium]